MLATFICKLHLQCVKELKFEQPVAHWPDFRADAVLGDTIFAVLIGQRDTRRLRAAILEMARISTGKDIRQVVLILEEPQLTTARLLDEWEGAAGVIRPELLTRLSMVIRRKGIWTGIPKTPNTDEQATLNKIVNHRAIQRPVRISSQGGAYYEILRLMLHEWLLAKGPITIKRIVEMSGTSYPTVAKSLARMEHYLKRHSDRRVALQTFPHGEWTRLLAAVDEVRGTVRFVDRSGQPRSPESLMRRLQKLQVPDIAIGGAPGAKRYYPDLDLVGTPRLDLCVHCPEKKIDFDFVQHLDPALEQSSDPYIPAHLVVHTIRRRDPLFDFDADGTAWADPVECLLDLHEAHLEPQALAFLNYLKTGGA